MVLYSVGNGLQEASSLFQELESRLDSRCSVYLCSGSSHALSLRQTFCFVVPIGNLRKQVLWNPFEPGETEARQRQLRQVPELRFWSHFFGYCMRGNVVQKARVEASKHWEKQKTVILSFKVFDFFQDTHKVRCVTSAPSLSPLQSVWLITLTS